MIKSIKILIVLTIWFFYAGMVTMAIIYDGIYIQICIDTALMLISGIVAYLLKGSNQNK